MITLRRGQEKQTEEPSTADRATHVAAQYLSHYARADEEALKLFYRIDLAAEALHSAGSRANPVALQSAKRWLARILRALYMAPEQRLPHVEIARETGVPAANVTYQIDALRDEGYVRRVPHPNDRRVTLVELTPKGYELCEIILPTWAALISKIGSHFTEEEKRTLNTLLQRLQSVAETTQPD